MKKLFVLCLVFALLFQSAGTAQAVWDIENHWAKTEIQTLLDQGIFQGYEDDTFRPNIEVTRAEFAAVMVRILKLGQSSDNNVSYSDVPINHWARAAIETGSQYGMLSGYEDGTFRPGKSITRAEAAAVLARSYRYKATEQRTFTDLTRDHWAYAAIMNVAGSGVIQGSPGGQFFPSKFLTRAEFAVMIWRTLQLNPETNLPSKPVERVYTLELERWGVQNNGTQPVETTKGINDALLWASNQGYTVFKVPAGTYLIKKGPETDPTAQINIPSNMTFWMDDNTVLQKETNGYEYYRVLYVGPLVENVTIRGGTLIGDRDTHDYSTKQYPYTANTHEYGYGIMSDGARNLIIDGVEIKKFTGDGIMIGNASGWVAGFQQSDIEAGSIDNTGKEVADSGKVRTKISVKTDFELNPRREFFKRGFVMFTNEDGVNVEAGYDVYFYKKDGTFISSVKGAKYYLDEVPIPEGAGYFRAVFTPIPNKSIAVTLNLIALSKHITVKNSNIYDNRRQGISVVGAHHVTIQNNEIHDIQGTAPESAIDFEAGRSILNYDFKVLGNKFYNNRAYNVVLYDGSKALIEGNHFGKSNIGLAGSFFQDSVVRNNTFENSGIAIQSDKHVLQNNTIKNGNIHLSSNDIVLDGLTAHDSQIQILAKKPFGVTLSNIETFHNEQVQTGLTILNNPIRVTNYKSTGAPKLNALSAGSGTEGTIFDRLTLIDYHPANKYPLALPKGEYNSCVFETGDTEGLTQIVTEGKWVFNQCQFKVSKSALSIQHTGADVTIKDSTIEVTGNPEQTGTVLLIGKAKRANIENNTINANAITATDLRYMALIRINRLFGANDPYTVAEATIKGNVIRSNVPVIGINTKDAGVGAPGYLIQNNTLYKALLSLKSNDTNENNTLIKE